MSIDTHVSDCPSETFVLTIINVSSSFGVNKEFCQSKVHNVNQIAPWTWQRSNQAIFWLKTKKILCIRNYIFNGPQMLAKLDLVAKCAINLAAIQQTSDLAGCRFESRRCPMLNLKLQTSDIYKAFPRVGLDAEAGWTKQCKTLNTQVWSKALPNLLP